MAFSQEIQDFISAFKTGAGVGSAVAENKYRRAAAKYYEERAKNVGAGDPLADLKRKKLEGEIGVIGQKSKYYDEGLTGKQLENEKRRRALQDEPDAPEPDTSDLDDEDLSFSNGGAVPAPKATTKSYAEGGVVEDEEKPKEAIPSTPGVSMTPAPKNADAPSLASVHDAVREGLLYNLRTAGLDQKSGVADPARKEKLKNYITGKDGADARQLSELDPVIDPKKEMSESRRNLAKLAYIYDFYQNRGESDKAKKAAGSLLGAYRGLATRFAAISAAAVKGGDVDTAVSAALKAYAYVPDGKEISLEKTKDGKIAYSYTNEDGKAVKKGLLTPDQLLQRVTKFSMGGFDDLVTAAAGERKSGDNTASPAYAETAKEPKPGSDIKEPDYTKMKSGEVAGAKKMYGENKKLQGKKAFPFKPTTQEDFSAIPGGAYFVNPKDGQVLRKKKTEDDTEE